MTLDRSSEKRCRARTSSGRYYRAVRTRQLLQVDLASWYIQHSMALAAVLSDLSRCQNQVLAPETRALLQSVDPRNQHGGWLDHLRVLVRRDVL
jgi:hypothetical protein